ncbi:putative Cucumber peeling cupredoxin [Melia azedarach]|uniref:Cucumber peeling cupredoxin n=1 Tax=Melia azedarach TaxID=155640 RepID=A0ACC1XBT6_MELAZ|nr:putative Cucumber peeling cupredoxin [Melia azedarach]
MGIKLHMIGFLIVVATLFETATSETCTVGDYIGWRIPPAGAATYSTWSRKKKFQVADTIVFNWTGTDDVAEVSKADYDKCRTTNPIGEIQRISPVNFTLGSNGTLYFICTVDSHCDRGQKVAINVGGAHSSASSLAVGSLTATFFTLFLPLLRCPI